MPENRPEGARRPRMVKPPVADSETPKPKLVQAPSRRGTGRRDAPASRKKSPMPLVLGGGAVVVLVVIAALVFGNRGDGHGGARTSGGGATAGDGAQPAAGGGATAAEPRPVRSGGNVEDELDRTVLLAEEFRRRKTLAESDKALWELATWCKENRLDNEMREVATMLLPKQSRYTPEAHRLLGHRLFNGEHPDYQDQWLTEREHARAMEAEKEYQHRLRTDPRFERIEAAIKNAKYLYLREVPHFVVREWPYVLFIEDFGTKERNEYYAAEKADQVRSFYGYMKTTFPDLIKEEPEIPYRVIVFKDGASYNRFNEGEHGGKGSGEGKSRARAHFSLRTKFVYYYEKEIGQASFDAKATLGVLFHECTHQLMNDLRPQDNKASPSMWFEEAFAEYIGAVEKSGREKDENGVDRMTFDVAKVNSFRLPHIQALIKAKRIFTLPEMFMCRTYEEANQLFRLKYGQAGGLGQSLLYCQGWSFVYFCMNGANGKYRDKMIAYIVKDAAGDSFGYETLAECFGIAQDDQWAPIEREWLAYVTRLQLDGTLKDR